MTDNPSYELFDELGRGEHTVVFRGYDLNLGRDVAIKQLDARSQKDPRRVDQFLKEASFLAQFEHENILRIYSVDKERGWIVMELMKGTLASQIADQPMPADTVRSVLRQILGALDFLHQKGKVHGSVRPSNLLINEHGIAKLSDFEAANAAGELRAPTGSTKHLAPELIRPDFGAFGPTVDLYCLGFTALELLAGPSFASFFPGTGEGAIDANVAWLRWHSSEEPLAPVKKLCPRVPDDLASVIESLLSKRVDDRPQTAKEVLDSLSQQSFIPVVVKEPAEQPAPATRVSAPPALVREVGEVTKRKNAVGEANPDRPPQKKSQRPAAVAVPASGRDRVNAFLGKPYVLWPLCAAILIAAIFIGLKLQNNEPTEPPVAVGPTPPPAQVPPLAKLQLRILPDSDGARVYLADVERTPDDEGVYQLEPGEYELRVTKDGFEPHAQSLTLQPGSEEIAVTMRALVIPSVTPEVDPDRLVSGKEGNNGQGEGPTTDEGPPTEENTPATESTAKKVKLAVTISPPDASFQTGPVASDSDDDRVIALPTTDSDRVTIYLDHDPNLPFIYRAEREGFTPVVTEIPWEELVATDFKIEVALQAITDLATVDPSERETDGNEFIDLIASLAGSESSLDNADKVRELAEEFTEDAELVIDSGGFIEEVLDVAFSPDGTLLAAAGGKVVRVWHVESGELVATLRGDRSRTSYGDCHSVRFSPSGDTLLVGVNDYASHGSIREYSTSNFDEIVRLVPGHTAPCRKIAFSGQGTRRVSADADGNLLIHDMRSGTSQTIPARNPEQPIFDVLAFPDSTNQFILAVDFQGPQVYSPSGERLGPQDTIPDSIRGWLADIFTKNVTYPFNSEKDPRVLDFALDRGVWAAAGVGREDGGNKFWAAAYTARGVGDAKGPLSPSSIYTGHRWNITCLALGPVSSDHPGELVATGDKFGEVHVWDRRTSKSLHQFRGQGRPIYEVAFDNDPNLIAFGTTPFKPGVWKRNDFGAAEKVLDLRQRAVVDVDAIAPQKLRLLGEQSSRGTTTVDVTKPSGSGSYFVTKQQAGKVVSQYRISSGRNPTVFTLLDRSLLGVNQPVLFGDNEGLLAIWDSDTDELHRAFIGHDSFVSAISPSPNGTLIASGSTDRTIRIWSLMDYQPTGTFDFKFENTSVIEVRPGTSSAQAGVRRGDQVVSIDGHTMTDMYNLMLMGQFDYRTGQAVPMVMKRGDSTYNYEMTMVDGYDFVEPVLSIYVGDDDQWIIWTPQGYYDASPGADRLIGWHLNRGPDKSARFLEVQQFRKQLYRPDVINRILEGEPLADAVRLANEARTQETEEVDFRSREQIAEVHPPQVTIISPEKPDTVADDHITFVARVESLNGLPIQSATLLQNGNVAKVFRPIDTDGSVLEISHDIDLVPGLNELELIASNAKATSSKTGVTIQHDSRQTATRVDAHVLAIGVPWHRADSGGVDDLYATNDVQHFVEAMRLHQDGQVYRNVNVRLLADESATKSGIIGGFQWLVENAQPNDAVIVLFVGPSFFDTLDNFYLGTHDTDTEQLRVTAVSWREFLHMLQNDLPNCQRTVFLDAYLTESRIAPGVRNPLLDLAAPELGISFFASNTLQQVESGSRRRSPRFTDMVIQTLGVEAADTMPTPPDQLLNSLELASSIRSRGKSEPRPPVAYTTKLVGRRNILELRDDIADVIGKP